MFLIISYQYTIISECHHINIFILLPIVKCKNTVIAAAFIEPFNNAFNFTHRIIIMTVKERFTDKSIAAAFFIAFRGGRIHINYLMFKTANDYRSNIHITNALKKLLH